MGQHLLLFTGRADLVASGWVARSGWKVLEESMEACHPRMLVFWVDQGVALMRPCWGKPFFLPQLKSPVAFTAGTYC